MHALGRTLLALALLCALPAAAAGTQFTGSTRCAGCHAAEAAAWRGSHHDLAMREASEASVRGDFDEASLTAAGGTNRFFRRGAEYWVNIADEHGRWRDYRIDYTLGVDPLQQYMTRFEDGRIQLIPFAWDARAREAGGQRWFQLYPQAARATHGFFWTNRDQNWNFMCADCHSTNVRKGYNAAANRYDSTWSEINVGCEACHGPGSEHVARAGRGALAEGSGFDRAPGPAASGWRIAGGQRTASPAAAAPSDQLAICAQCHSRREQLHDGPARPDGFFDRHLPDLIGQALYHADGQILEEVFEYGPFLQSRMHLRGVSCTNCHEPHSGRMRQPGDALCAQCHAPAAFADTGHHGHRPESPGARCVACHMPQTTYMQVDVRHDHGLRVPDPALSARIGTPDACTRCHEDRTQAWAAQALAARGRGRAPGRPEPFAPVFAAAALRDPAAEEGLARIATDAGRPPLLRAAALQRLSGYGGPDTARALAEGARNADPLLRLGAIGGSGALPREFRARLLLPLLGDGTRAVRTQAAAALLPLAALLPPGERPALEAALAQYRAVQEYNADRGYARTRLGDLERGLGHDARSEAHYRGSIAIEPTFPAAWVNLADLLHALGRDAEGSALLDAGLEAAPGEPELLLPRALAAVRAGDRALGLRLLGEAVVAAPQDARLRYVHGIALEAKDIEASLAELDRAAALDRSPQYRYARCEVAARNRHASAPGCIAGLHGQVPEPALARLEALLEAR